MNIQQYYADSTCVGDWGGKEELAASQFNKIVNRFYAVLGDDEKLSELVHCAWDSFGSEDKLLTLTDSEIDQYVARFF